MTVELPQRVRGVLGEGRQAYLVVNSKNGPHVTPELYAWSGGRLWFAAARPTLKAKVLRRDPAAGAIVSVAGRSVVLTGEVTAYDPLRPFEVARHALDTPAAARALVAYTARNAPDLAAFVTDTVSGKLGWRPPPLRQLFALRPLRIAMVENDRPVELRGWGRLRDDSAGEERVRTGGERAVAAFPGAVGLPGRWFGDERVVQVAPGLLSLVDLPTSFPMSVVTDDYTSPGPAAKRGVLLRGVGRVDPKHPSLVHLDTDRVVEWDGVETSSSREQSEDGPVATT